MNSRLHIFEMNPTELQHFCTRHGMPDYTSTQILDWVYRKHEPSPERFSNLSKVNRTILKEHLDFERGQSILHQRATDGTHKLLLRWKRVSQPLPIADQPGELKTESVMIPTDDRRTACISSQVGCPVGCSFCASGLGGLEANLSAGEIVEQVHHLSALRGMSRISNVVFMGMGEPLANFGAVSKAIRTLNASWGFGIGARKITVSTVGLPDAIRKLVAFEIPVTLALSLHAPNDELRRQLIPWAAYASIDELIDACREYFAKTGREITLEYILLGTVNDQREHAYELAHIAKRLRSNINLIRYNEVKGLPYNRPSSEAVRAFQHALRSRGINCHIRASRGRDIAAACGQLRHESARQLFSQPGAKRG